MTDLWTDLQSAADAVRRSDWDGVPDHAPSVAILTCSDARVAPSSLFGAGPGEQFVVRVAGNTLEAACAASLDYAVEHLGVGLIVVVGHTSRGAVAAALAGACSGRVVAITEPICRLVAGNPGAEPDEISALKAAATAEAIRTSDGPAGRAARTGAVSVVAAIFDLASGALRDLDPAASAALPTPDHEETS